ncbi:TlpA family protein disulfide reductase [Gaetbulibacter saemankumensis]|uniref:TlpA family protein disulfide reductase n=1 Tax=Gaetbulibacter saemankumensis TaxID=311208 RepID=UPI000419E41F|nr:TlpA disulfide reductase family protein [Gaetbulibacter saemankumensis]
MKHLFLLIFLILSISCNKERPEPNFYKNLYTGEVLNKAEFEEFRKYLHLKNTDSIEKTNLNFVFYKLEKSSDSIIQNFKYNLRIGDKYLIRTNKYEKIGMKVASKKFTSIDGKEILIGGKQEKPTLINLWFIHCPGCIAEIPALNRLKEKYSDKVNFVSLTFEEENDVSKFLNKKTFKFTHIANVKGFIKKIGSYPYPENIFIDKNGYITNIEGGLPYHKNTDLDSSIEYFESIIKKLL